MWYTFIYRAFFVNLESLKKKPFVKKKILASDNFPPGSKSEDLRLWVHLILIYILSPEGRCEAYPVGVQLFLLRFYLPKGEVKHIQ